VHIHRYVKDADALTGRAVKAGAKLLRKVEDQFKELKKRAEKSMNAMS
jgi:hypothetical protein